MTTDLIKKMISWPKFNEAYEKLIEMFNNIKLTDFRSSVKSLNEEATSIVDKIKEEAIDLISPLQDEIQNVEENDISLNEVNSEISELKTKLGVTNADMQEIIETKQTKSWTLLIFATAIVILDYLIGGIVVFASNQSIQITITLMMSALLAAVFYAVAAPIFATSRRLYSEIRQANRRISEAGAMKTIIFTDPESVMPNWLSPSQEMLPHSEGNVFFQNKTWNIERSNLWGWVFLSIGTLLSFVRLMPVLVNSELYGSNAIWYQTLLLIIALLVNAIIFFLEYRRRDQTGLPNVIQDQINEVLKKKEKALKSMPDQGKSIASLKQKIENILAKANKNLSESLDEYTSEFNSVISQKNAYATAMSAYKQSYNAFEHDIDAFYAELTTIPEGEAFKSQFQKGVPTPAMVEELYPSPEGDIDELKLNVTMFKITLGKVAEL